MKSHFIERLILKSTGRESGVFMRPAITPDVLPLTFPQPSPTSTWTPLIPTKFGVSARETLESPPFEQPPKAEKEMKPEEDTVTKVTAVTRVTPPKETVPVEGEAELQHVKAKGIEPKELEETARTFVGEAKKESKTKKTAEDRRRHIRTPKVSEKRLKSVKEASFQPTPSRVVKDTLGEVVGVGIKRQMPRDVVPKRIRTKTEYVEEPSQVITYRTRSIDKAKTELAKAYARTDRLVQEAERLEQTRDLSEPTVNINIERVEVRAIMPKKPPAKKERIPALSLKDYLKQRRKVS